MISHHKKNATLQSYWHPNNSAECNASCIVSQLAEFDFLSAMLGPSIQCRRALQDPDPHSFNVVSSKYVSLTPPQSASDQQLVVSSTSLPARYLAIATSFLKVQLFSPHKLPLLLHYQPSNWLRWSQPSAPESTCFLPRLCVY